MSSLPRAIPPPSGSPVAGRLSVIVPTRNSARTLDTCLRSVRSQTYPDVELIVVDNHSDDATPEIAHRWADRVEMWGPERSAQRNRGAALATGEYLLFLDSDLNVDPRVSEQAVVAFSEETQLGVLVIPERAFGEGFWSRCRALEKDLYLGDHSVEAGRLFRLDAFDEVDGYDENLNAGEDWDLADRVEARGWRLGRVAAFAHHDEGGLRLSSAFARKRYYGRWVRQFLRKPEGRGWRGLTRTSLFSQPRKLARHPVHAAGLLLLKAVEGLGLLVGMFEGRRAAA